MKIFTYGSTERPKEINVKMPEVNEPEQGGVSEASNNNDGIRVPLRVLSQANHDLSESTGLLDAKDFMLSAPETPTRRSSDYNSRRSLNI